MATPDSVWTDAITKLPDDPRSVGRWFPYLNRGSSYVEQDRFREALRDFQVSSSLGDQGMGVFNMGAILAARGRHADALAAFERAEREGYNLYNLPFQRGLSLLALGRAADALKQMEATINNNPPSPMRELALLQMGRAAMQAGERDKAAWALEHLVEREPKNREGRYLLGMVYVMRKEPERAIQVLDALVRDDPNANAYYARALAHYALHHKAEALADIEAATQRGLDNANVREWRTKIQAMP
jgi:tetratricopeptide (TPR) repeat protein